MIQLPVIGRGSPVARQVVVKKKIRWLMGKKYKNQDNIFLDIGFRVYDASGKRKMKITRGSKVSVSLQELIWKIEDFERSFGAKIGRTKQREI